MATTTEKITIITETTREITKVNWLEVLIKTTIKTMEIKASVQVASTSQRRVNREE
jgi:hypothetical protein